MNEPQPEPDAAVLGGITTPIALVLGGLEGCKRRISTANDKDSFLREIVNVAKYGDEGRSLAITTLHGYFTDLDIIMDLLKNWSEGRELLCETFQGLSDERRVELYSTWNWITAPQIEKITKTGGKFKTYLELKVGGQDCFSSIKREELSKLINKFATDLIEGEFDDKTKSAAAMRWYLRGLPVDKAIHKVRVDEEVSLNAMKSKYS